MAEGPQVQVETSVHTRRSLPVGCRSACQSGPSSLTHLSRGAGPQEESGANQRSAYCKELLMREGEEFSFEELRAERYKKKKQQELEEKLKHMVELKEQLSLELEEKKKLLLLRRQQQQVDPEGSSPQVSDHVSAITPFQIYDESQSSAAQPAGNELTDDVFLRPDERGLCLKIQHPQPGAVGGSEASQQADHVTQSNLPCAPPNSSITSSPGDQGGTEEPHPPAVSQRPAPKTREKLSPIQETSVEATSVTSLGGCSPLDEEPDHESSLAGGAVDPCDPDVRRRLLDLSDVTSSPGVHSERRPLPAVEEHSCLQLGGVLYHIYSKVVDGGSFSIFKGATEDDFVLIKLLCVFLVAVCRFAQTGFGVASRHKQVDGCSVPWDFHQFQRLKTSSSTADSLPLISCFLFLDGCITVYITPTDHMFTEMAECVSSELLVAPKVVCLLQLVLQLHSCRLLHAALQPSVLTCCHRGLMTTPGWVFPVDWSSSVDLELQQDVTSVQQVPSAQSYVSLGLLEPDAPPQLVDLVGVAETVHLLLTNSKMVAVKDGGCWTAKQFSGEEPCDFFSKMWRGFFRSLLNAGGRSSLSVLSELKEQLSALYQ